MKSLHPGSGPDPSGDTGMNCDHLDKFEEKHVISILMYVAGNPGCKKTDIYDAVSRNPRMPEKIEILESMGLMTHETVNRSSFYKLTAGGINIANMSLVRDRRGGSVMTIFEIDQPVPAAELEQLKTVPQVLGVIYYEKEDD